MVRLVRRWRPTRRVSRNRSPRVPSCLMEFDHVLIAVADLDASVGAFESLYGLASVEGGRHPGWGTANRIVPLGDAYLELVAVVDQDEAVGSVFGRWVQSGQVGSPLGWAVRTKHIDAVAQRLDLEVRPGSRRTAGGEVVRWRAAGIEQAAADSSHPFFIEWALEAQFPGLAEAHHPAAPTGISKLVVNGDAGRLSTWLGSHALPIIVRSGNPGVASVVVSTAAGEIVVGMDSDIPT
jgi:Glyoxalase-like domain